MNWVHAIRFGGGNLTGEQVQLVRNRLDELGYETELDIHWIGRLGRGSSTIWRFDTSHPDLSGVERFISALAPEDVRALNAVFGEYSLDHLSSSDYEVIEDVLATPYVGAATILPLPRRKKS